VSETPPTSVAARNTDGNPVTSTSTRTWAQRALLSLVIVAALSLPAIWTAAPSAAVTAVPLDPSFGNGGMVVRDPSTNGSDTMRRLPDGKLIVLEGSAPVRIVRLLADGAPDSTFATAGPTPGRIEFFGRADTIGVDSQQRMVVQAEFFIRRYLPDGTEDPSFTPLPTSEMSFISIAIQPDDKIVGSGVSGGTYRVGRLNVDGTVDTTFNAAGAQPGRLDFIPVGATNVWFDFVSLREDGSILVYGAVTADGKQIAFQSLVTSSGTLDTSFGNGGSDLDPAMNTWWSAVPDGDGRIVAVGPAWNSDAFIVRRSSGTGTPDTTFGNGGRTGGTRVGSSMAVAVAVDGKILVGGSASRAAAVYRFNTDGSPDSAFSSGGVLRGRVLVDVPGTVSDEANSVIPLSDGGVLAGGAGTTTNDLASPVRRFIVKLLPQGDATTGTGFNPVTPNRVLDTRNGIGAPKTKLPANQTLTLQLTGTPGVPTTGVTAATLNMTVTNPDGTGYLTVYPCNVALPNASNLNYVAGQNIPNLVTVPVAPNGTICLNASATTDVIADIAGWYSNP
jgi:uncharacterized delta-60 repeat protein